jgi:hypothetical protein
MSAISVTAASVAPGTDCAITQGTAGASITAGMPLYIDTANGNVLKPCDADASDLASTVAGISLHASSSGQPIAYATAGRVTFNAVLTAGKAYVAGGTTAGDINPIADLTTNWRTSLLGIAYSTTSLRLQILNTLVVN